MILVRFAIAAYSASFGMHYALIKISAEMDKVFTELATDFDHEIVRKECAFESKKKSFVH